MTWCSTSKRSLSFYWIYYMYFSMLLRLPVHDGCTSLVVWKKQSIRHNNILSPSRSINYGFCDIFRCQWLTASAVDISPSTLSERERMSSRVEHLRIDGVSLTLITIKSHDGELSLDLARIDANNSNPR